MSAPVVFDCDGVLVDSEALAWSAWREVLARFGVEVTDAEVSRLTGRSFSETYRHFASKGLPTQRELENLLLGRVLELFETDLEPFEDAVEAVSVLVAQSVPVAVASSSPRQRLDLALRKAGVDRHVEVSVAGDEVSAGKPAPDLYLKAAEALGVAAGACIAVEDAPAGIEAAKAAGMFVVAVLRSGWWSHSDLKEADLVVERLTPDVLLTDR